MCVCVVVVAATAITLVHVNETTTCSGHLINTSFECQFCRV